MERNNFALLPMMPAPNNKIPRRTSEVVNIGILSEFDKSRLFFWFGIKSSKQTKVNGTVAMAGVFRFDMCLLVN